MAMNCIIAMDLRGRDPRGQQGGRRGGYDREEVIGQQLSEKIIPPSLRQQREEGLARYLATGEGPVLDQQIAITAMSADGTEFSVELGITSFALGEQQAKLERLEAEAARSYGGSLIGIGEQVFSGVEIRFGGSEALADEDPQGVFFYWTPRGSECEAIQR